MKKLSLILPMLIFTVGVFAQNIDQKVDSLLSLMTLDEKIGQMAQAERGALESIGDISYYSLGSLLSGGGSSPITNTAQDWADMYNNYQQEALQSRLGIPLIYGVDAVHGHNNVYGAVIFPHNIGLGCTWNPELVTLVNQITATEVAATGIDWTFSPCIAVPQNERWGRTYEGFGETAEIQKIMAAASVNGLQGNDLADGETILACAKHFVGDGGTTDGVDQGNTQVSEELLRSIHMSGYVDAIASGVGSIMASYNSWNGEKLHGHQYLLTDVLKTELGFEGFVVSDWKGVDQINGDYRESVKRAINAGIDMVMVPDRYIYFISVLKSLVEDNEVELDRIDDAVRRILKQKFLLNLFEEPIADNSLVSLVGSDSHREVARQAVRESMVLLNAKNDVLPLDKNNMKILVAGDLANDLGAQCGGWSISWQGSNGQITEGTTILEGLNQLAETSEIIYSASGTYADLVDAAIVVIGENPYAEGAGDRAFLNMNANDVDLVKSLKEKGIPVVCILLSGRPMIIGDLLPYTDAFIAAWLPGTEGTGVADIIFGDYNPSGLLSHSWPVSMDQIPINYGQDNYHPLFEYKHGLTNFPAESTSEFLLPFSAITNNTGEYILLSLCDTITDLSDNPEYFSIKINDVLLENNILDIAVSETDPTVLIIELNSAIQESDLNISISFNGDGVFSNTLPLKNISDFPVFNAVTQFGGVMAIPGIVQAEYFAEMFGIQTEPCTDVGGGMNVAYFDPGDWLKYTVDVSQSGLYEINSRISGYVNGSMLLTFDGLNQTTVNFNSTNGWQSWESFTNQVLLEKGIYEMKVIANNDAFNINYFEFTLLDDIREANVGISEIRVFPNPASSKIRLEFTNSQRGEVSIALYEMNGKLAQKLYKGVTEVGNRSSEFVLNPLLPHGLYFVEIKDVNKRYFVKLIIE